MNRRDKYNTGEATSECEYKHYLEMTKRVDEGTIDKRRRTHISGDQGESKENQYLYTLVFIFLRLEAPTRKRISPFSSQLRSSEVRRLKKDVATVSNSFTSRG